MQVFADIFYKKLLRYFWVGSEEPLLVLYFISDLNTYIADKRKSSVITAMEYFRSALKRWLFRTFNSCAPARNAWAKVLLFPYMSHGDFVRLYDTAAAITLGM